MNGMYLSMKLGCVSACKPVLQISQDKPSIKRTTVEGPNLSTSLSLRLSLALWLSLSLSLSPFLCSSL